MKRERNYLKQVKSYTNNYVTFDDDAKGKIMGKGKLVYPILPNLEDVLLVKGLTANIISINQLCDRDLCVNFNHFECIDTNKCLKETMKGTRSSNNYYMWKSQSKDQPLTCLITKEDETNWWNKTLGHLNLRSMINITYEKAINGHPNLKIEEGRLHGEFQIDKQTKMPHKKLQHLIISKVSELLHMDLMVPMEIESLDE